jgi:hypothetical protein
MSSVVTAQRPNELVHVAVIRNVRKGREAEFETQIARFFDTAAEQRGVCGAYLIRPAMGDGPSEYGILRSFGSTPCGDSTSQISIVGGRRLLRRSSKVSRE